MSSSKMRKVVRIFFNTFYTDVASAILDELEKIPGVRKAKVVRSRVVPEFYYVELEPADEGSLQAIKDKAQQAVLAIGKDKVFGVKVYATA